ncbi:MAG: cell division protein FtsZ [Bdellovibrionales bacterium]|nr:cell division protein FtsZ [Massilia sp.]
MSEATNPQPRTVIKVIGVGGAGCNAVAHMASSGLPDIEFICTNTDAQALASSGTGTRIQLGESGLGAGSDPTVGRDAANRERSIIAAALTGANMVFITAGMGGGTGTGAAPIIAEVAREMGILTVGVVSKPFTFEGSRRMRVAEEGIALLSRCVDSLVVVLNSRLEQVLGEDITQKEAFHAADEVLSTAVGGIADIINVAGMINVDFEDVRTVMRQTGTAMMGSSVQSGPDRAIAAAEEAIACPLLDGSTLNLARGLLVNIAASEDSLKLRETKQVMNVICAKAGDDTIIKFGAVFDDSLGDAMRVTVVATGLSKPGEAGMGMNGRAGQSSLSGYQSGTLSRTGALRVAPASPMNRQGVTAPVGRSLDSQVLRTGSAPRQQAGNPGDETGTVQPPAATQPGNH